MEYMEFRNLVRDMRKAQDKYFRMRIKGDLDKAKRLETKVDNVLNQEDMKVQGKLF